MKALVAFLESNKFKETFVALAIERLTRKQKRIIAYLSSQEEATNVTNLVDILSKKLNCSYSTMWNNLRSLKSAKIIHYGSKDSKGLLVRLLDHAKMISKKILEEDVKCQNKRV